MSAQVFVAASAGPDEVLGKAQLIFGAFESGAVRLRVAELSRRSWVPKASAYRLAQELVQWGLLERLSRTAATRQS
ncbi:helix-turn-helix domain-containing protein [Nonomuraea angiospora]|uniref:helix-turn-helix domain-containing protein n=1 Tax=Nonomuraea angiospora TaxID=46172 RepID=UPI0029A1F330|nr:helix-turn-helix domain-containing protein [Nonomuraea angiospora]MDX3106102.1 helix-turn-helix domain-containing protein [Nonomuraea angiospora]